MKKCPTCGKEFEDSMKFCQIDGTSLENAAEEPAFDPYATMVSMPKAEQPAAAEPVADASHDDLLDVPPVDPLKTMMVSDAELQQAMADIHKEAPVPEPEPEPEPEQPIMPTPPEFISPAVEEPSYSASSDMAPPPSPFSDPEPESESQFDEAATIMQPYEAAPTQPEPELLPDPEPQWTPPAQEWTPPPTPVQEWTPPPAPDASWQNQQIGSNTPFQSPVAGVGGTNNTLAIVSLVLGILSICCYISPLTGIAAIITGFLATKNIKNDPNTYGGKGLAIAGMICGGVFLVIGVVYYILLILGVASGAFR